MDAIARYLGRLDELKRQEAEKGLQPASELQTEFGYGRACGIQLGIKLAEEALNTILNEQDEDDGISRRSSRPA